MVDENFVRAAVDRAELGALRLALYQATGDPAIAAIPLERTTVRGGAGVLPVVPEDRRAELKDAAVRFLLDEAASFVPRVPAATEIDALIELAHGEPVAAAALDARRDLLAFEDYTRQVKAPAGGVRVPEGFHVTVVGAGFSGIAIGVQLGLLGIPYTILEKRHEAGGVWSINTYPDARVDTLSATYQFSFEKNYAWSEHFARQDEVRRYLETVARHHGVAEHMRFGQEVVRADWREENAQWELRVRSAAGERTVRTSVLVTAVGLFSLPRDLDLPGIEDFAGEVVHTTRWGLDHTVEGKRVAVIGNGSTGVQLLGAVARDAAHTTVFQRTPQWISPRERYGEPVSPEERWLLDSMPYYWNWTRYTAVMPLLDAYGLLVPDEEWIAAGGKVNARNDALRDIMVGYLRSQVGDRPDLVAKLVPDYAPIARRPIVDNGWYKALTRDDVELVTDPIERVTPTGIRTAAGREHKVDLIIAAVGFQTDRYLGSADYRGRGGESLHERWARTGAEAHIGMTVPGFPNMFMLYGPNSQPVSGANTLPMWFEVWSGYIAQCLLRMFAEDARLIEVREDACADYNARMQERASGLIYLMDEATPHKNYYVNAHGKLGTSVPWDFEDYQQLCSRPNPDDFILS